MFGKLLKSSTTLYPPRERLTWVMVTLSSYSAINSIWALLSLIHICRPGYLIDSYGDFLKQNVNHSNTAQM